MIDLLAKYAFRSFKQVLIHVAVAVVLSIVLNIILAQRVSIDSETFVSIVTSIAAASGALLAVTLALFFFFTRHFVDSRDRFFEQLIQRRERLREQMEKSTKFYPDISRNLSALYDEAVRYVPGKPVEFENVMKVSGVFLEWAIERAKGTVKPLDMGDPTSLNSFELHLHDAVVHASEIKYIFAMLSFAHLAITTIPTYVPLIIGWLIIAVLASILAVLGGTEVVTAYLRLSILIIPFYLFIIAVTVLIMHTLSMVTWIRGREIAYERAKEQLIIQSFLQRYEL